MTSAAIALGVRTASTPAPARSSVTTMRRSWSRSLEIASTRRFDKIPRASAHGPSHAMISGPGAGGRRLVLISRRQVRSEALVRVGKVLEVRLVIEEHVGLVGVGEQRVVRRETNGELRRGRILQPE